MILRFDQVELGLVIVVVAGNILVGDVDARGDFLVQHLVASERAPQVALEVIERYFLVLQALVKFFGGVGRLDFVELAVHFFVGRQQPELFRALHEDFRLDQLIQNAQPKAHRLLAGGLLIGARRLVGVILVDFAAINLPPIDRSHDVAAAAVAVTSREPHQEKRADHDQARSFKAVTIFQVLPSRNLRLVIGNLNPPSPGSQLQITNRKFITCAAEARRQRPSTPGRARAAPHPEARLHPVSAHLQTWSELLPRQRFPLRSSKRAQPFHPGP